MANYVKLRGDSAEFPYLSLRYPVAPAEASLREGLAAYQGLALQVGLQSLPLPRREEIAGFLARLGGLLYRVLFPEGQGRRLQPGQPILLEADAEWCAYPWELLHDGRHWLALQQGLVRYYPGGGHPGGGRPPAEQGAASVLAVTAEPLPGAGEDPLARAYRGTGGRFISSVEDLPDPVANPLDFAWHLLEHAQAEELERALRGDPGILLWSGFATREAWLLEGKHLQAEPLSLARLGEWLGGATRRGLRLLIANDSLGLLDPAAAGAQAAALLASGPPALIRIEGVQARVRQHDYVRSVARHMSQGFSAFESHLAAVRRLHRRFEASWDWSYLRFHTRHIPTPAVEPPAEGRERSAQDAAAHAAARVPLARPVLRLAPGEEGPPGERTRPAPPVFRRRRRVFARHAELRALAQALLPDQPPGSPFVFLNGPAGSGKSVVALELARRLHRRFDEVVQLEARDLLPDPAALPGALGLAAPSPAERLAAALALRLGTVAPPEPGAASAALARVLADGARRLLILDGLEGRAGFEDTLGALAAAPPAAARILVTGRGRPPVLPGFRVELRPVDGEVLAALFDETFVERIRDRPDAERLLAECRRDLLAARVLRRLGRWPEPGVLAGLLAGGDPALPARRDGLLAWAAAEAAAALSLPARQALEALSLLTGLVHQETLGLVAGLEGRRLADALTELQWSGLADLHDGERYLSLHPRLLRLLGERLVTRAVYGRLAPRLARAYETYLAATGGAVARAPARSAWRDPSVAFAWQRPQRVRANSADPRAVQRLGAERANLAEAALMMLEEADAPGLARLVEEARPLADLPWQTDLQALLGTYLHACGEARKDEVLQSRALNRIGAALLAGGDAARAARTLERALDLVSRHASWDTLSETYLLLARAYARLDHLDGAENLLVSAVELAYQLGAGGHLVAALSAHVELWRRRGREREQAEQFLPRAIAFLEERHQLHLAAQLRRLLADCRRHAGDPAAAEGEYRRALESLLSLGDRREAAQTGISLAECLTDRERADPALEVFEEASHALQEEHAADPEALARTLQRIARLYERQRRFPDALRAWLQVRDWRERNGDREGVIAILDVLGGLYFQLGEQEQSTRCYEERLMLQAEGSVSPAGAGR